MATLVRINNLIVNVDQIHTASWETSTGRLMVEYDSKGTGEQMRVWSGEIAEILWTWLLRQAADAVQDIV